MLDEMAPRQNTRYKRNKSSLASVVTLLTLALYNLDRRNIIQNRHSVYPFQSAYMQRSASLFGTYAEATSTADNVDLLESSLPRPINYYELLGLESPNTHRRPKTNALHNRKKRSAYRARITNDQIKKAYRKQAQLYHPDKLAARRLKQEKRNVTEGNVTTIDIANDPLANMTIEEATSLFARIAEAYQVLSDPAQRFEYDWELLEMEDEYEEERLLLLEQQQVSERDRQRQDMLHGRQNSAYSAYDSFPLYETIRNGASSFNSWKDNLNLDPWAVFEDFFFQESSFYEEPDVSGMRHDNQKIYSGEKSETQQRYYQTPSSRSQFPSRVSETTVYRGFDPVFGAKVYTVLRREDYIHDIRESDRKFFYQILGQDFISGTQVDPYTGFTLREYFSAITEPYFVEEGYSSKDDNDEYDAMDDHSQTQMPHHEQRLSIHKLEQGESITPDRSQSANIWISPNGLYEAILTPTCELQILRHEKNGEDTTSAVIWTSETYIPALRADGCHLTLNAAGRLILSVDYGSGLGSATVSSSEKGHKGVYNTVLWSSPMPPVVPHLFQGECSNVEDPVSFLYYASLDNDGVIAVYRVRRYDSSGDSAQNEGTSANSDTASEFFQDEETTNKITNTEKNVRPGQVLPKRPIPHIVERLSLMYQRISKASIKQQKTKAALAWDHLRYNVGKFFTVRPKMAGVHNDNHLPPRSNSFDERAKEETHSSHNDDEARSECVYSTSPVGCLAPGRNAIYLTKTLTNYVKSSVKSIDSKFDKFLSHLTEPVSEYDSGFIDDDEDEDILDTLIRVTGAAGAQLGTRGLKLGKAGMHAAQVGLRQGRLVAGKVVGKMKEKVGKQSVKWGERITETEHVDPFF
eukprot:CCRYP_019661-RB/>CCRYP_019661-RB protein AED:0.02 eAED:0.02 QI:191/1/0.8/1/0.5/0.4/5/1641/861